MNLHANIAENQEMAVGHVGWKYYNSIKKKAMEQEFSWSGLFLSLSIAFFIVISSALLLNLFHQSFQSANVTSSLYENNFYRLETTGINTEKYINTDYIDENRLILKNVSELT